MPSQPAAAAVDTEAMPPLAGPARVRVLSSRPGQAPGHCLEYARRTINDCQLYKKRTSMRGKYDEVTSVPRDRQSFYSYFTSPSFQGSVSV